MHTRPDLFNFSVGYSDSEMHVGFQIVLGDGRKKAQNWF
jgi:hypothetical protein